MFKSSQLVAGAQLQTRPIQRFRKAVCIFYFYIVHT